MDCFNCESENKNTWSNMAGQLSGMKRGGEFSPDSAIQDYFWMWFYVGFPKYCIATALEQKSNLNPKTYCGIPFAQEHNIHKNIG